MVSLGVAEVSPSLLLLPVELETYTLIIHTAYGALNGMAFTSYGEALVLALQNLVILALMLCMLILLIMTLILVTLQYVGRGRGRSG
jgi:hypothetical protein